MSMVDNVMISAYAEPDMPQKLNAAVFEACREQGFEDLVKQAHWGGFKYPECDLYGAAFNYASLGEMMTIIAAFPWRYPDTIQVFIHGQEDFKWTLYDLEGCRAYGA